MENSACDCYSSDSIFVFGYSCGKKICLCLCCSLTNEIRWEETWTGHAILNINSSCLTMESVGGFVKFHHMEGALPRKNDNWVAYAPWILAFLWWWIWGFKLSLGLQSSITARAHDRAPAHGFTHGESERATVFCAAGTLGPSTWFLLVLGTCLPVFFFSSCYQ